MKLRYKLILDLCLFFAVWFVMSYQFTSGLIHEILGFVLIIGFAVHITLNGRYYFSMLKRLFRSKEMSINSILSYIVNVLMLFSVAVMLISSFAISNDLLPEISNALGNYSLWRTIHIIAAVLILVCILFHILLHVSLFNSILSKKIRNSKITPVLRIISGILAIVIVVGAIKVSINCIKALTVKKENAERYLQIEKKEEDTPHITELIQQEDTDTDEVSLENYLKGLFCDGCGRHCSLLTPNCRKGQKKAEQAKQEYYSNNAG